MTVHCKDVTVTKHGEEEGLDIYKTLTIAALGIAVGSIGIMMFRGEKVI